MRCLALAGRRGVSLRDGGEEALDADVDLIRPERPAISAIPGPGELTCRRTAMRPLLLLLLLLEWVAAEVVVGVKAAPGA